MPYTVEGYEDRAQECVRLAGDTQDSMLRTELLKLRQTYLTVAERLRRLGFEVVDVPRVPRELGGTGGL
jgi:hypothetical protein